jgi:hypothetical protein
MFASVITAQVSPEKLDNTIQSSSQGELSAAKNSGDSGASIFLQTAGLARL